MTWVRNDDQAPLHRKVAPLSDSAFRLNEEAKCWASRNGTDGRIAADEVASISVSPTVQRGLARFVAECVRRRLWHRADDPPCPSERCVAAGPDGWVLHDYLDYNPSAEEVARERKAKRERMARWREAKRHSDASPAASRSSARDGPRDALQDREPDAPVDVPVPSPPTPPRPAPKEGGGGAPAASAARRGAAERADGGWAEERPTRPPLNGKPPPELRETLASLAAKSRSPGRVDALTKLRELTPEVPVPTEATQPIPAEETRDA